MNYITLANGVKMPQLGLGIMNIQTQENMDVCVKAALEAGCSAFDCAYCYGNEKIFGTALKNSGADRKKVFITTKSRTLRHSYLPSRVLPMLCMKLFPAIPLSWKRIPEGS